MLKGRRLSVCLGALFLALSVYLGTGMTAMAADTKNYLDTLNVGVASIIDPSVYNTNEIFDATILAQQEALKAAEEETGLVMADVQSALNVRMEPNEEADKVGKLYKDCGGTILERKDGWTKLQSGNVIGWASDAYLLFGEDAEKMAGEVGQLLATNETDALRLRKGPSTDDGFYTMIAKGEDLEVIEVLDNGWVNVVYDDTTGYVSGDYVNVHFLIDSGETIEEIKERKKAEEEAKKKLVTNYGAATVGADDTMLLAALIQCEAGSEPYEGQLAVGAVVMNRVRSGAYPDNVYGVIYASGQFTPAMAGKVDALYVSGKVKESCVQAAQQAIAGDTNVGSATHFRRNNGTREGVVIGKQVFW